MRAVRLADIADTTSPSKIPLGFFAGCMAQYCRAVTDWTSLWLSLFRRLTDSSSSPTPILFRAQNILLLLNVSGCLLSTMSGTYMVMCSTNHCHNHSRSQSDTEISCAMTAQVLAAYEPILEEGERFKVSEGLLLRSITRGGDTFLHWSASLPNTSPVEHWAAPSKPGSPLTPVAWLHLWLGPDIWGVYFWRQPGLHKRFGHSGLHWTGSYSQGRIRSRNHKLQLLYFCVLQLFSESYQDWRREHLLVPFITKRDKKCLTFWSVMKLGQVVNVSSALFCCETFFLYQVTKVLN